jgi:hypothetical protein
MNSFTAFPPFRHSGTWRLVRTIFAVLLAGVLPAVAEDIVWDFGTVAPGSAAPLASPANLTVSDVSQGNNNGIAPMLASNSVSTGYPGASGTFNAGIAARAGAFDAAMSAYFEFTLTPAAGYRVTLSGIDFGTRSTSTGPQAYSIRSSADSYAGELAAGSISNDSLWVLMTAATSLTSTAPLTLRMFGHSGTGGTANNWRIDDLKLSVIVALEGAPTPTIADMTPLSGIVGTPVTITGTNFGATPAVRFNGTLAPGSTVNPEGTSISATVPAGATTGFVTVTAEGGVATSPQPFTVAAQPALTVSIFPSTIPENAPAPGATGTVSVNVPPATNVFVALNNSAPASASVPPFVTLLEGTTSATFDVNAIANPGSVLDATVTITATAPGYDQGAATITIQNTDALGTLVVINKYMNGTGSNPDMIELLVIGDGTPASTVNMRNMLIKDHSASMASDNGGKLRFNDVPLFSAVKAGTLLVLSNNATSGDTDASDYVLSLGLLDTTYFTSEGGTFDIATTEMVMIKGPGQPAGGVTGSMHVLAGGVEGTQFTLAPPKKLIATGTSGTGFGVIANNATSSLADYDGTGATGAVSLSPAVFGLANNNTNNTYIRTLRGTLSVDGAGAATITNETSGSLFAGKNYFPRGSSAQTVAINLVSNAGPDPLTSVKVTVPAVFGAPVEAGVSVTGAGAGFPAVSVSGQEITISGTNITTVNAALISVANLPMPNPTAVTDDGRYAFTTATAGPGGTLTNIAAAPVAAVSIPVANLRDVDANGTALDNGKTVAIEIVCTEENFNAPNTGTSAYGQDGDFGINVFIPGVGIDLTRGRRYAITGQITQFNGLTEILPGSAANITDTGEGVQPAPLTISVPNLLANAETYEGRLIRVTGLSYVGGTWGAAQTVNAQDAAANPLDIRIQSGSSATTEPAYPVTVTGIFGQFDSSVPRDGGYQIMPRDPADLEASVGGGYELWAASYGLTGSATDDDDRDGASNFLEYATGSVPNSDSSLPQSLVTPIGATLTVTWAKGPEAASDPSLSWAIEASTSMEDGTWSLAGILNFQNGPTSVSADYAISPGTPKIFLRLRVVRAPGA